MPVRWYLTGGLFFQACLPIVPPDNLWMRCDRLRFLQLLVVCSLVAAGAAEAQTVILRKAAVRQPRGAGRQHRSGRHRHRRARTAWSPSAAPTATLGQRQLDARVYVDVCGATRRVIITERGVAAPPSGACGRTQIEGLFHVQRMSTPGHRHEHDAAIDAAAPGTCPGGVARRSGRGRTGVRACWPTAAAA